jgi:hypothetical protein
MTFHPERTVSKRSTHSQTLTSTVLHGERMLIDSSRIAQITPHASTDHFRITARPLMGTITPHADREFARLARGKYEIKDKLGESVYLLSTSQICLPSKSPQNIRKPKSKSKSKSRPNPSCRPQAEPDMPHGTCMPMHTESSCPARDNQQSPPTARHQTIPVALAPTLPRSPAPTLPRPRPRPHPPG